MPEVGVEVFVGKSSEVCAWLLRVGYLPLESVANIYDAEPAGSRSVNLRDFAVLAVNWLGRQFWPED